MNYPLTWFALGISGEKMGFAVLDHVDAKRQANLTMYGVSYNKEADTVVYDTEVIWDQIKTPVLLIDSANHSGRSMLAVTNDLMTRNLDVITYSLVTKIGSQIIPSYFGVLIGYRDRVYFQLPEVPNNRLQKKPPFGVLRRLNQTDVDRPYIKSGVASLDKENYGDHFYDQETEGSHVYIMLNRDKVLGLVKFKLRETNLVISLVAVEKKLRGSGVGGALIRWAETWARNHNCKVIELWAIENMVDMYKHVGFEVVEKQINTGGGENYVHMRRSILYHIKPNFTLPDPHG
ncbi:MAG: GNAT family N-acetyltransferase [Vitreimonas sp.]